MGKPSSPDDNQIYAYGTEKGSAVRISYEAWGSLGGAGKVYPIAKEGTGRFPNDCKMHLPSEFILIFDGLEVDNLHGLVRQLVQKLLEK